MSLFDIFKVNNKVSKKKNNYSKKDMTLDEATQIFDEWCLWFWPNGALLEVFFPGNKPESLLPYNANKIDKALKILWDYYDGLNDKRTLEAINESILHLGTYSSNEHAIDALVMRLKVPNFANTLAERLETHKREWINWLKNSNYESKEYNRDE